MNQSLVIGTSKNSEASAPYLLTGCPCLLRQILPPGLLHPIEEALWVLRQQEHIPEPLLIQLPYI